MLEYNEVYNSIIKEFKLCDSSLKQTSETAEGLTKARIEICKLLKMSEYNAETLNENKKRLIAKIDINKLNIIDCEKKQIALKEEIIIKKKEIKVIKIHINELEHKITQEKQESRKFREALYIFISREKFKIIKKIIIRRYRKVFLKYSSEIIIKTEIMECNRRKENIREEKQNFNNTMEICNKKIIMIKKVLAETRKKIINNQKSNRFIFLKLQKLEEYKKNEKKFRLEVQKCEGQLEFYKDKL
ncbi:hypothetical protein [Clostridium sp.]|uniref:hypothetical protein n=1 Tax=Clostridium sp. TaxID=1506 RepID=UPI001A493280|nr:hypothetical protein [Clostridium sp.]MBK5242729.1 hypothetical protein [Clostridium sp.]